MKLKLDLSNCYGINKLSKELDFNSGINSLYAPNGTLKTSLAKTFKDIETNKNTKDLIFPDRITIRNIKIDGADISADQVMVIDSYNESYSSQQLSTLLVNEELKQQYDTALKEVDGKRTALINGIAKKSGKRDVPSLFKEAFGIPQKELLGLLVTLSEQEKADYTQYGEYKYDTLFNPKVLQLITSEGFSKDLADYVDTYDKLIENSTVLSKTFNHQKADVVSKSLTENGFFNASHSVNISVDGSKQEVSSKKELNDLLQFERDKVLQNTDLKEKFIRIDSKLKNKETQVFRDFISEHQELLGEFSAVAEFKKKVLIGYLQSNQAAWDELVSTYKSNQELVATIVHQAQQQKTTWETVVDTFNKRFKVPFKLSVENQDEVILNNAAPAIKFEFDDGRGESEIVSQSSLVNALSQGEKRALYILNVLFEIEVKQNNIQPLLVVIDDIADSFDYKNKYAIVEYLRDIAKVTHFSLLLLTHNFDFHRIVSSRLGAKRQNRHMATKSSIEIVLKPEKYQKDVFNAWKQNLATNEAYLLASIPFARNLAEYCGHEDHYKRLTSLLHLKTDTKDIKVSDMQTMYREIFKDQSTLELPNSDSLVFDKIIEHSDALVVDPQESPELECKVILAMAIRLQAEHFMITRIADPAFVEGITSNQTRALYDKFIELHQAEQSTISLLDQVNLMTPENIHLNSFMYEPILDMSAHSLYQLYSDIKQLINSL
ncbi:hypothetical protein [Photobacterium angustum]|uniref:Phage infection protein n=1 Tax=Photobacterium angustum TaxID=661 RepID=A0A2S7VZV2_PHOAN|nr:hypothetical protein [Photobacterium angustum]PQJ67338.1 hypothetical protein BTO08_07905 [Photobacterium angustum]